MIEKHKNEDKNRVPEKRGAAIKSIERAQWKRDRVEKEGCNP